MSNSLYTCNCDVIHEDIVNDVKGKMQPKDDYIQLASLFKLFGDGTRVQILHALEQSEMCVCDLAVLLGVTKSAISHQLKALRLAGLVKFRREAQIVYYSLADDHVKEIIDKGFEHLRGRSIAGSGILGCEFNAADTDRSVRKVCGCNTGGTGRNDRSQP